MKNGRIDNILICIFAIGLLLNCLFFTKLVIDITLVPRYIFLSFFLFSYLSLLLFSKLNGISIDIFTFIFFIFLAYGILSILWAHNTSLAVVDISKLFLFFTFFIICQILLQKNYNYFIIIITKTTILLFFISLIPIISEIINIQIYSRYKLYEISAISGHKNLYSSFVFLCTVMSFFGLSFLNKKWKTICHIAIFCQFGIILFLQTRTVYLALVISFLSFLLLFLLRKKNIIKKFLHLYFTIFLTLILMNIFFLIVLPKIINLYIEYQPKNYNEEKLTDLATLTERVYVWEKSYDIFKKNTFLGIGANNWQVFFPSNSLPNIYRVTDLNVTFQRPHNDFLWVLTEYGVLGFNLFYSFVIGLLLFIGYTTTQKKNNIFLFSGILGYLCISFFDFPKERIEHNLLFYLILSISVFNIKKEFSNINKLQILAPKLFLIPTTIILLFLLYISFLNFKGEYLTKQIYKEKMANNNKYILSLCNEAISFCYTLDPTSIPILWYKGNANANLRKFDNALIDLKLAYQHNPYNHYVLNDLASAFYMNNYIDSAKYYYKEAVRINPRFDEPKLNLTAILINESNYIEAKKWNESIFNDSDRRDYYRKLIDEILKHN
jgi:O-antigen ligase